MSRPSARARRLISSGLVGAVIGVITAVAVYVRPDRLERIEFSAYDVRARSAARRHAAPPDIVLVEISDQAIADVEANLGRSWPWPRPLFGYIAEYAANAGAKAVVFDWLFQDRRLVSEAEEFAAAIGQTKNTVIGLALDREPRPETRETGAWGAALGEFPSRDEATAAALLLLSWDVRVYVSGSAPAAVHYGGLPSADGVTRTWERLASSEELAPLFTREDGSMPAPRPVELPADTLATELTAEQLIRARDGIELDGPSDRLPRYHGMDPPLAVIAAAPARTGAIYQDPEDDGVMRRYAPLVRYKDRYYPSLALAAYLVAHPGTAVHVEDDELVVGARRVPIDEDGLMAILFYPPSETGDRTYDTISAYSILRSVAQVAEAEAPEIPPQRLRGKYVIVTAAARALRDLRPTPIADVQQGAEINANVLGNIERGEFIDRASRSVDAVIALVLCLVSAAVVVLLWTAFSRVAMAITSTVAGAAVILGGYWLLASWAYAKHGLWLAAATPIGGAAISAFAVLLITTASERRGRRFVQEALGRYTSPALVRELTEHPEYLSLEWGETRDMSIYFSDIAGFTSFSEDMEPEQLVALLNDYLTEMTNIVLAHDGVVDKYIGDAIMAFWGAPILEPAHAAKSVRCAIAMRNRCEQLRPTWEKRFGKTVTARSAVNSGIAVVGNMGSRHKYNYTVMGDTVNLASRLEGANKPYGTLLMISEATRERIGDEIDVRTLDRLAVQGKEQPVEVFEVLDHHGVTDPGVLAAVDAFHDGLRHYRQREFSQAIAAFERAIELQPDDSPSAMYIQRCKHFVESPPPPDWDGVWHLKEK